MNVTPNIDGPRACSAEEFDQVLTMLNRIFRTGSDQRAQTDYPLIFNHARRDNMRVVTIDGQVVAHVPVWPRKILAGGDSFTMAIIGGTATHEDHRHQGYATLCLRDNVRIMRERGWAVSVLWTIEPTFPFYRNSGWESARSQGEMYTLKASDTGNFRMSHHQIARYEPGNKTHLRAIARLHDIEQYRIDRSPDDYEALFSLPKMHTLLSLDDGVLAAYLTVGHGTNKLGLVEGGGDPRALEALVRHARSEWPEDEELQVTLPLTHCGLGGVLKAAKPSRRRAAEEASGVGFQMMRVNDAGLLMTQISNHLHRQSSGVCGNVCLVSEDTDESVTLRVCDGSVKVTNDRLPDPIILSRPQLAQLVFGAHPSVPRLNLRGSGVHVLDALFPFYFPVWELDHS